MSEAWARTSVSEARCAEGYKIVAPVEAERRKSGQGVQTLASGIVIPPGRSWKADLPASPSFEISAARLDSSVLPFTWPYAMGVAVNGGRLSPPLLNKGPSFVYGTVGCLPIERPYYSPDADAWAVFPSPDFEFFKRGQLGVSSGEQAYRYVWDVSALVGSSPTMSVEINNNGLPSPNNGLAGGLPLVVKVPRPLVLSVEPDVFSPNGDGILDVATVSIRAAVPWRLRADGAGVIARGGEILDDQAKPVEVLWDGTIEGKRVDDGVHSLRLEEDTPSPGLAGPEATVSVDTTPPVVEFALVWEVEDRWEDGTYYKLLVRAADPERSRVSSGLDPGSVTIRFKNASFTRTTDAPESSGTDVALWYKLTGSSHSGAPLFFDAVVRDKVGNASLPHRSRFEARLEEKVLMDPVVPSGESLAGFAPVPVPTLGDGDVFYVKSDTGRRIKYELHAIYLDHLNIPVARNVTRIVMITRVVNGKVPYSVAHKAVRFVTKKSLWESPATGSFFWDGKTKMSVGMRYVPEGRYETDVWWPERLSPGPGFTTSRQATISFKVSDHEVIKAKEWGASAPAIQTIKQAYHVLCGHLVAAHADWFDRLPLEIPKEIRNDLKRELPAPQGWVRNVRAKRDFFGYSDGPILLFADSIPLLDSRNLFGDFEKKLPLSAAEVADIQRLMARTEYQDLMRLAEATWANNSGASKHVSLGKSKRAPIVLRNGAVVWVFELRFNDPYVHTIFPNWEFQNSFEKDIQ